MLNLCSVRKSIMKKKISNSPGIVFSTDPNFKIEEDKEEIQTLAPNQQVLRITLETKHRAGKTVTLVTGFVGLEDDMAELGKTQKPMWHWGVCQRW